MRDVEVVFRPADRSIVVPSGTLILDAARRAGVDLHAPCNGQGTCGRCRVLLADRGSVLACRTPVTEDLEVEIPRSAQGREVVVLLEAATPDAPADAREPSPLGDAPYGVAIDIGTTTVAAELIDLASGEVRARAGVANSQAAFGAEVTRRMEHVEDHGVADLAAAVRGDLQSLVHATCEQAGVDESEIGALSVAGNTVMTHLLHAADPTPIRTTPHTPAIPSPVPVRGAALELDRLPETSVHSVPWIGGWVGGDITAGIGASGMARDDRLTLLMDVGTNGEIVLGCGTWRLACAASAGPAFEGCGLRDGTAARPGAIDRVRVDRDGGVVISTIADAPPVGICGSGLISSIAAFFEAGWIDRAGRINPRHVEDLGGEPGLVLVRQSGGDRTIGIAQRDIDAALRAKAAMFAGVRMLARMVDIELNEIERLILSGGFGSVLDPADAVTLGMLPPVPRERMEFAGNTSLRGARDVLLYGESRREIDEISRSTTYVELVEQPGYFEEYTSALFLPHTDETIFPQRERRSVS